MGKHNLLTGLGYSIGILARLSFSVAAADPTPPILNISAQTNSPPQIQWIPYPAAQSYHVFGSDDAGRPFTEDLTGTMIGPTWTPAVNGPRGFFRLQVESLDPQALLAATVLHRLAYGPTPDDLPRVLASGPQAFIEEQLAPELIQENLDFDRIYGAEDWQYVTVTGTGSSSLLYVYLTSPGEAYLDDLSLVAGSVAGAGVNLIRNGDFETPLTNDDWTLSTNLLGSSLSSDVKHGGNHSLHIVASATGSSQNSSIWQTIRPALSSSRVYTLSYWYRPSPKGVSGLTIRLSGSGITSSADTLGMRLQSGQATIDDLRAWHLRRAVESPRQLLEILDQFCENHFVTQYSKSREYFDAYYPGSTLEGKLATQLEYKENQRWRQALLKPDCTFQDLLTLSAESPAMIIYLDTVNSKGNGKNVANENYARELLELFTFGVDNGYDQNDITVLSQAWTGWSVNLVDAHQEFNPLASRTTNVAPGVTTNFTAISNLVGVWAFNYKKDNHHTNAKTIFAGKTVPARFGPPYAGRSYQLVLPARSGTNGLQDSYDVIAHLANQPFTQEFISVKLCQWFVHDEFATGYDFNDPDLSPEGQLVRQCMAAWETGNPQGQIRQVLATLFNSDLFRRHGASLQKVKTPLEFTVSTLRTLRARKADGTYTASTDGFSLITPLNRMGGMSLFDRADPDGYPESAPGWISAGTLAERLRFVQTTCMAATDSSKTDGIANGNKNLTHPTDLIQLKLPAAQANDAGAVADYWLSLLFPAEGKANLERYRASLVRFLDTADNGVTASPFQNLAPDSNTYDTRLRGAVALLLTFQRFQEQ